MTITIEEAIKYLIKPVATSTEIGEEKQKEFEAYNMAVQALKDKRAYCTMAGRSCFAHGTQIAWCLTCPHISEEDRELVKKAVEGLQPKTGEWIHGSYIGGPDYRRCNQCFAEIEEIFFGFEYDVNYCPNCGAKMGGDTE